MRLTKKDLYYGWMVGIALAGVIVFTGCESDDEEPLSSDQQVESISIHPEIAELEVGEQLDFSVVGLTAEGDTVDTGDLEVEWSWWSTDEEVFTVEPGGLATARGPGEAYCVVEATILHKSLRNFTGRDSAFVMIF
jgi:hypothetical protein